MVMREYLTVGNGIIRGEIYKQNEFENIFIIIDENYERYVVKKKDSRRIDRSKKLRNNNLMAKIKVWFPDGNYELYDNAGILAKKYGITTSSIYTNARLNRVIQKGKFKGLRFEKMR